MVPYVVHMIGMDIFLCSVYVWFIQMSWKVHEDILKEQGLLSIYDFHKGQWDAMLHIYPDSKVHGANIGPIWGRQNAGGPHVGPMNFAIWVTFLIGSGTILSIE